MTPALVTFAGAGNGSFGAAVSTTLPATPALFASGDFNGDTYRDVVVRGDDANTVSLWLGGSSGTFTAGESTSTTFPLGRLVVADLTGDALEDVLAARSDLHGLLLFGGNGDGTLDDGIELGDGEVVALAVADLDDDGDVDITTTSATAATFSVYLNNGDGTLATATSYSTRYDYQWANYKGKVADIAIANVTSDAIPDVVLGLAGDGLVATLVGAGSGTFAPARFELAGRSDATKAAPRDVEVADINGDSRLDLVYRGAYEVTVSYNDCGDISLSATAVTPIVSVGTNARIQVTTSRYGSFPVAIFEGATALTTGFAAGWQPPEIELPLLPAGSHSLLARFEGNDDFFPADAESVAIEVTTETSTAQVELVDPGATLRYGDTIQLRPIVTSTIAGTPMGMVRFFIDGVAQEPVACCATFYVFGASVGTHEFRVEYLGSDTHPPSPVSAPLSVDMERGEVTMQVNFAATSQQGNAVPIQVTTDVPGDITILDGGTVVATGVTTYNASTFQANLSLSLGLHRITARYDGGSNYLPSESTREHTVLPAGALVIDARSQGTSIRVDWISSHDAIVSCYIQQKVNGLWQTVTGGSTSYGQQSGSFSFLNVDAATTHVYRVFVTDWYGNTLGPSNIDAASIGTFLDETLIPRATPIKLRHFTDIVDGINRLRRPTAVTPLSPAGIAAGQIIRYIDFVELRYQANQARRNLGMEDYPFTDRGSSRTILIRDIEELRRAVQ